jgi:PPK2 family polyphosphate:nucleotide phosphotransferase
MKLSQKLRVKSVRASKRLKLSDWDPNYNAGKKKDVEEELIHFSSRISELQHKLFADNSQSLLILLQGIDTSGKDSTIRHVMGAFNPQSCYVAPFRVPSAEELSHDYLWRIHMAVPSKGQIAIFNRFHYEDVIESRVHNLVENTELNSRCRQINDFERYLSENHIRILKFFLHISKNEQKKRLEERLENPSKHWKISGDIKDRKYWNKYMESYEEMLNRCSTEWAPWYIIPANFTWFRNWAVSSIIIETLDSMKLKYPRPKIDVSKFVIA